MVSRYRYGGGRSFYGDPVEGKIKTARSADVWIEAGINKEMEADPDGMNEDNRVQEEEDEQDEVRLRLERDRNELLRQELEITRRERDLAQREVATVRRELGDRRAMDRATSTPLRADVKGIGELLDTSTGRTVILRTGKSKFEVKRLFTVDDAIMKIIISSKLKGKAERWFCRLRQS